MVSINHREQRTDEQLWEHYTVEKKLANQLRNAAGNERRTLYVSLYEELYRLIPNHPQLSRKKSPKQQQQAVQDQMKILRGLLDKKKSFMEIGPGDCALSLHVANLVKEVHAVDVSKTVTESKCNIPDNFKLTLSDGCSIPVAENSIDIIYSNQLMEHLHPDDAHEQLKNIFKALAPEGVYLCITPSRLNGPHDISQHVDTVATGFHLKEYTITELSKLFKNVGFSKVMMYIGAKNTYIRFPILPATLCEAILEQLPNKVSKFLANTKLISALINVRLIGIKSM